MSFKFNRSQVLPEVILLQQGEIGQVLSEGLSELVSDFPVHYFAHWLLNYNNQKKNLNEFQNQINEKKIYQEKQEKKIKDVEESHNLANQKIQEQINIRQELLTKITESNDLQELIKHEFPNRLRDIYQLNGVYIGCCENANSEERLITYIGYSDNQTFMEGQTLPINTGVTYSLYKEEVQEEGEEKREPKKSLFVPEVTKEKNMHYFNIPKLGSYFAVKLVYNSYLNSKKFRQAVQEKQAALTRKQQLRIHMEEAETAYKKEVGEAENEAAVELTNNFNNQREKDNLELEARIELPYHVRNYLVCMDSFDLETPISQQTQEEITQLVQKYAQLWEQKEFSQLNQDIDLYLSYLEKNGKDEKYQFDRLNEQEEIFAKSNIHQIEKWQTYEKIFEYEQNALRLERVSQQLTSFEVKEWLSLLSKYNIMQYTGFIELLFIFLKYDRDQVVDKHSNTFKWSEYKKSFVDPNFIKKMVDYQFRGSKPNPVSKDMKMRYFEAQLQAYTEAEINDFNLGLGRIYRWLVLVVKCRISDVQKRTELKNELRTSIAKAKADKDKWDLEKENYLQRTYDQTPEEEKANYDRNVQEAHFIQENPEIQIPKDVQSDVDLDIE